MDAGLGAEEAAMRRLPGPSILKELALPPVRHVMAKPASQPGAPTPSDAVDADRR